MKHFPRNFHIYLIYTKLPASPGMNEYLGAFRCGKLIFSLENSTIAGRCIQRAPVVQLINRFLLSFSVDICIFSLRPIRESRLFRGNWKCSVADSAGWKGSARCNEIDGFFSFDCLLFFYELMSAMSSITFRAGRRMRMRKRNWFENLITSAIAAQNRRASPEQGNFNPYQLTRMIDSSRFHMISR